ncbi:unnamed protein product [Strongylus vulgaris]|uniref:G-protein coupled receptors family 1 profile domain-containing protein n=1 Tax=Strongylus vulgaris TaxID=40348 RepID=A0A3P7KXS8_STRVU|nr:unnamed protein product [Strongylus vulgaris]
MGVSSEHIPLCVVIITMGFCALGFFGNAMIVFATLKSPRLRNRCNLLICSLAFADLIVCVYLMHMRINLLRGWNFCKNSECYLVAMYGLFAMNIESGVGLVLGIDRLIAVVWPERGLRNCANDDCDPNQRSLVAKPLTRSYRYINLPKLLYVTMMATVFIYSVFVTLFGYWYSTGRFLRNVPMLYQLLHVFKIGYTDSQKNRKQSCHFVCLI